MTDELSRRISALSPEKRALLEQHLLHKRAAAAEQRIPRRRSNDPAPLSFSQLRLWFLDQWAPGDPTYNAAIAMRLDGPLDLDRLRAAFDRVVARHQVLRTVFQVRDGTPRQVVLDEWSFPLPIVEAAGVTDMALHELLRARARRPFDLTRDLMLRATVFRRTPESAVVLVDEHHVAFDAWSDTLLFEEVSEVYTALAATRPPVLPELTVQYADFALWQQRRLTGPFLDRLVEYWRRALADAPARLELPLDHPRPPVQAFAGAHHYLRVGTDVSDAVGALARAEGATVYMTLLAAFVATLYRWAGTTDICVGTPIAGRGQVELEPLIGFFSNTLVMRVRVPTGGSFRDLVRLVRTVALGAYEHQELPFEKVVETLAPPRDPSRNPLFQVNFRAQTTPAAPLSLPGVRVTPLDVDLGFSRFDLALELQLHDRGLAGYIEYNEALFTAETAVTLAERFANLLRDAAARPDTGLTELAYRRPRQDGGIKGSRAR